MPDVEGRKHEELAMKILIGAAVVAGGLALAGLAAIQPAAAASPKRRRPAYRQLTCRKPQT